MYERHWELNCVMLCVKHLAFWFLGFHGCHSTLLIYRSQRWICQQLHLNWVTQYRAQSVTIGVLCIWYVQTWWWQLARSVAIKNIHMTAKVWDPIFNYSYIHAKLTMTVNKTSSLYITGIVFNVSVFVRMWNHCWFYICICIRCALNMQNCTNSYD
jgi:hypothetical protein